MILLKRLLAAAAAATYPFLLDVRIAEQVSLEGDLEPSLHAVFVVRHELGVPIQQINIRR